MNDPMLPAPEPAAVPENHTDTSLAERARVLKHILKVDAALFLGVVSLALLGVGITTVQGGSAHYYWAGLMVLMALATTGWGMWRSKHLGVMKSGRLLLEQTILWGGGLVAVVVIYQLLDTEHISYETTGLLVLLVLTLVTFVDGLLVSWKLYVVSGVLLSALLTVLYAGQFLWLIVLAAVVLAGLVLAFVFWRLRSHT